MISWDSRTKKPKLWNLMFVFLAVFTVLCTLYHVGTGNPGTVTELNTIRSASVLLCLYYMTALFLLGNAFRKQLEYNPYSYNTIYYSGFFLFVFFLLEVQLYLMLHSFTEPQRFGTWDTLLSSLLYSARTFVVLSLPLLLTFCTGLFLSNIVLIRKERKSFSNILGMILSFMILAGEVVLILFEAGVFGPSRTNMLHDLGVNIFAALFLYFECMLMGTIVADSITATIDPPMDRDYMIILGCGIRADGTPTPLLQGRLNKAIEFYYRQLNETGKELRFVVSGGQGSDEKISESDCMRRYLLQHGIRPEQIMTEDRSTDTAENMRFSRDLILKDLGLEDKDHVNTPHDLTPISRVAFSTTNYHCFRSGLLARRVKMRALGIGAPTRWYFWPNASVREFVGLLTAHRLKQALILVSIILAYTGMTLLVHL